VCSHRLFGSLRRPLSFTVKRQMRPVALFDESPLPAGFLLLSNAEPVESTVAWDCILMVFPRGSTSPATEFLAERKHQEFSVSVTIDRDTTRIEGRCRPEETLVIDLPSHGRGRWSITGPGGVSLAGECEWASGN
jgi:hypothetical protein